MFIVYCVFWLVCVSLLLLWLCPSDRVSEWLTERVSECAKHYGNIMNSPSCSGSIVWIISCNRPWRNFAPVCVLLAFPPLLLPVVPAPLLDPGGPDLDSEAARDVTEPPGCVAIEVSEELAALPFFKGRHIIKRSRKKQKTIDKDKRKHKI